MGSAKASHAGGLASAGGTEQPVPLLLRSLLFCAGLHPLQLGGALLLPAVKGGVVRHLETAGVAPVQAVAAGKLVPLEYAFACSAAAAGAPGALAQGVPAVAALFQPHIVRSQRCTALRAVHGVNFGVGAPGVLLHVAVEHLKIPVVAGGRAQAGPQGFVLGGVGRKARPQVQQTADIGGVQRIGKCIVELPLHGDTHAGDDAFQRHALALFAGVLPQEHLLQVVPDGGPGLVNIAQVKVLLEHRHIVHAPLGKLGVRAAPLHKAAQALHDGLPLVQIGLRQAGDLGDVVLQLAEDTGAQMDGKGIQYVGVLVDLYGADLYDLAPEGLLHAVVIKGIRLVADVPFQIK